MGAAKLKPTRTTIRCWWLHGGGGGGWPERRAGTASRGAHALRTVRPTASVCHGPFGGAAGSPAWGRCQRLPIPAWAVGRVAVPGVGTHVGRRRRSCPAPLSVADRQSRSLRTVARTTVQYLSCKYSTDHVPRLQVQCLPSDADSCSQPIRASAAPMEPTMPIYERLLRGRDGFP